MTQPGTTPPADSLPPSDSEGLLQRLGAGGNRLFPGILAAVTVAVAATFLSDHYGAPVMLFALLLGMAFHFLSEEGKAVAGIQFSSSSLLRIGVALLGMRITLEQILSLGGQVMALVVLAVLATIAVGVLLARALGYQKAFGVLAGGSVGICGASAALAISAVLPQDRETERNTIFTVICVTALSTLAMILYPPLVDVFGLDHEAAGIFLGGTIHDVAQVVGAGYSVSDPAGDTATVIKLLRVAMLVPIVFALSLAFRTRSREGGGAPPLPLFILFFVLLVGINSSGLIPEPIRLLCVEASRWCLVTAIAALGMKTSLKALFEVGWKPVILLLAETFFLAVLVMAVIFFL